MIKMFLLVVLLANTMCSFAESAHSEEFIVQEKPQVKAQKLSRSKLKEELGDVAKQLFSEAVALVKRLGLCLQDLSSAKKLRTKTKDAVVTIPAATLQALGAMHEHIAYIQKACGSLAEGLLDDEPHLSKASKVALNNALQTMREALGVVKKCQFDEQPTKALLVQKQANALSNIVDRMRNDACLRHS